MVKCGSPECESIVNSFGWCEKCLDELGEFIEQNPICTKMPKFSFIIPYFGKETDNNLKYCLEALMRQTFKDFEVIVVGNDIKFDLDIKIKNIVVQDNSIGKLMNIGMEYAIGEYIHVWSGDLIVYPNYLENLNEYIYSYKTRNLFAGQLIDVRGMQSLHTAINLENRIFFNSFDKPEGFFCIRKKYMEKFREEFKGHATHWCQELLWRLWRKMKFVYMEDVYVVHIPHPMRLSPLECQESAYKSGELFDRIKLES